MLLKKTMMQLGFTFKSTHSDHVLSTLPYATGLSTSSYSVAPSSKAPRLFVCKIQNKSFCIKQCEFKLCNGYRTFISSSTRYMC
ncbi:hypothetical protein Hanom_Chr02g00102291 [Helianthus anomalus]